MLKKRLFFLFAIFLLINCKKDSKPATDNIIGQWALYSQQFSSTLIFTSEQYPCLANNFQIINADHTLNVTYTGKDTCLIKPQSEIIGIPGQAPLTFTWNLVGNKLYAKSEDGVIHYADITNSNGKQLLTLRDTFKSSPTDVIENFVYIKTK